MYLYTIMDWTANEVLTNDDYKKYLFTTKENATVFLCGAEDLCCWASVIKVPVGDLMANGNWNQEEWIFPAGPFWDDEGPVGRWSDTGLKMSD